MSDELRTEVEAPPEVAPAAEPVGRQASLWRDAWRQLRHNPLFLVSATLMVAFIVMAYFPQAYTWFYPGTKDPRVCDLANSLVRPNATHWFGFDLQGCDYYARSIHGARASITVGLIVTVFATLIAVLLGMLAGYYGGIVDSIIARIVDIWFAIPVILGGIVILSVLRTTLRDVSILGIDIGGRGILQVSLVLVVFGWPTMARLMRSQVLQVKQTEYVEAARALGAGDLRIMVRHILPNAISPVIVYATITVGVVIAVEATLSFLGVGLQLPAISWGLMISVAQTRILQAPHLLLFPALLLSLTVFSFILMGDALRDALDPKLR